MDTGLVFSGLVLLGSLGTLAAFYYSILLSRETRNERYWVAMAIAAGLFAIHQWLLIPWEFGIISEATRLVAEEVSVVLSSIFFGYSVHGLYSSMRRIRDRIE